MQNVHHLLQKADEAVYASELAEVHAQAIDGIFAILDDESFLILPTGLVVCKQAAALLEPSPQQNNPLVPAVIPRIPRR